MGTIKHSINVSNTLRYSSDWSSSYRWATVSTYDNPGKYNCFGKSGSVWNVSLIQIPAFNFAGVAEKLSFSLYGYYGEAHKFRWALCTSMTNKTNYQKTTGAVSDSTQVAAGTFTFDQSAQLGAYKTLTFEVAVKNVPANKQLYLYLWAYEAADRAPHISPDKTFDVTLHYMEGLVYIDSGSGLEAYMPYIDNGSGWDLCQPYVDNGSGWDLMA